MPPSDHDKNTASEQARFEDIEARNEQSKKGKNLDFTFLKKKVNLKARYYKSRPKKIRISHDVSGKGGFYVCIISIVVAGILILFFFSSSTYKFIKLIYSIRNQKILIGFQNSAELRPTGGFWGSFAFLNIGSSITNSSLYFETNPYKNDNPLLKESDVELPKPMKEAFQGRPQSFVNANWSIDFPEAAKTIEWYFGEGWNENSDAVVAVSSLAMIDLLKIIGPVQAKDGTTLTSENFTQVMSQKIETEYWNTPENLKTNEPKTIILDLAPQIIEKAKRTSKLEILSFVFRQLKQGRIIAYFNNQNQENIVRDLGFSDASLPYRVDFLSVNNANLGGNKSSLNVSEKIDYDLVVNNSKPEAQVKITRALPPDIWPNVSNKNYLRVVTPLGSKLVSAKLGDSDISNQVEQETEAGKTTFGFWFNLDPGKSQSARINYELPITLEQLNDYQLVYQKQPGTNDENLDINILGQNLFDGNLGYSSLTLR